MEHANIILWLVLLGVFAWCAWWHVGENRRLKQQWHDNPEMMRFAWSRSVQLLLVLAAGSLLIMAYDWQLGNARSEISALEESNQRLEATARKPLPAPAPAAVAEAPAAPVVLAPAPVAQTPIEQLYAPDAAQARFDDIKKRYEDILVTHMFLNRCGKVEAGDYAVIASAMRQEIIAANAPDAAKLQVNIMSAATGSYNEIYRTSLCDDKSMDSLVAQYKAYLDALKLRFPL